MRDKRCWISDVLGQAEKLFASCRVRAFGFADDRAKLTMMARAVAKPSATIGRVLDAAQLVDLLQNADPLGYEPREDQR